MDDGSFTNPKEQAHPPTSSKCSLWWWLMILLCVPGVMDHATLSCPVDLHAHQYWWGVPGFTLGVLSFHCHIWLWGNGCLARYVYVTSPYKKASDLETQKGISRQRHPTHVLKVHCKRERSTPVCPWTRKNTEKSLLNLSGLFQCKFFLMPSLCIPCNNKS